MDSTRERERARDRERSPASRSKRNYHDSHRRSRSRTPSRSPYSRRRDRSRSRSPRRRSSSPRRRRVAERADSPAGLREHDSRGGRDNRRRGRSASRSLSRDSDRDRARRKDRDRSLEKRRRSRSSSSSSSGSEPGSRRHKRRKDKHRKRRSRSRSNSRDRERKEKKRKSKKDKKKHKSGAVSHQWGKYGIINETDLYNKEQEFRAWLVEERKINPETITKEQTKKEFARFVEDYNTATLPHEKFYHMEEYERRMDALRAGEYLPPADDTYDPLADMKAHESTHKRRAVERETYMSKEQLMELRKVQNERIEAGKMKLLGMDIKQNMGVRMDGTMFDG
ncbi:hypothetical protein C8Q70DRAFT_944775 [Cubamyces menziesii]|nr:hypothetical protein C8Q70DRAFT_944775 [Cubamyces menziesii]